MVENGKFIVIDGMDGAGKKTQCDLLAERLLQEGYSVKVPDFPQYGHWSSQFVERYLRGEFGGAHEVSAKKASILYAVDRFEASSWMKQHLSEGGILVSNRYVSANKGHQLGKITDEGEMREFLDWLNETEYNIFSLPIPDITIFLHMAPAIGQRLVDQKGQREYTKGQKRDIHERDLDHLVNAERAYLFCVDHDPIERWQRIICDDGTNPRSRENIHEEVYRIVREIL